MLLPLGTVDNNFLFIRRQDGKALSSIGAAVSAATKSLIGTRINPHFFRSIIASALLSHRVPLPVEASTAAMSAEALANSMLCSPTMIRDSYFVKPLHQQNAQNQLVLEDLLFRSATGVGADAEGAETKASESSTPNQRCRWSEEENQLIHSFTASGQKDWNALKAALPTKSLQQIKEKFHSLSRKRKSQATVDCN